MHQKAETNRTCGELVECDGQAVHIAGLAGWRLEQHLRGHVLQGARHGTLEEAACRQGSSKEQQLSASESWGHVLRGARHGTLQEAACRMAPRAAAAAENLLSAMQDAAGVCQQVMQLQQLHMHIICHAQALHRPPGTTLLEQKAQHPGLNKMPTNTRYVNQSLHLPAYKQSHCQQPSKNHPESRPTAQPTCGLAA